MSQAKVIGNVYSNSLVLCLVSDNQFSMVLVHCSATQSLGWFRFGPLLEGVCVVFFYCRLSLWFCMEVASGACFSAVGYDDKAFSVTGGEEPFQE